MQPQLPGHTPLLFEGVSATIVIFVVPTYDVSGKGNIFHRLMQWEEADLK